MCGSSVTSKALGESERFVGGRGPISPISSGPAVVGGGRRTRVLGLGSDSERTVPSPCVTEGLSPRTPPRIPKHLGWHRRSDAGVSSDRACAVPAGWSAEMLDAVPGLEGWKVSVCLWRPAVSHSQFVCPLLHGACRPVIDGPSARGRRGDAADTPPLKPQLCLRGTSIPPSVSEINRLGV